MSFAFYEHEGNAGHKAIALSISPARWSLAIALAVGHEVDCTPCA